MADGLFIIENTPLVPWRKNKESLILLSLYKNKINMQNNNNSGCQRNQ